VPDDERPTDPPPSYEREREERPTLVPCLVCDGEYTRSTESEDGRYRIVMCAWCTNGGMDEAQRRRWAAERLKPQVPPSSPTEP
jgi:hypothetical protein